MTGVFPSVLKTAKAVFVFKKDSKLDYSNYCPISLLSDIERIVTATGLEPRTTWFLNEHSTIWPNWPNDRAMF